MQGKILLALSISILLSLFSCKQIQKSSKTKQDKSTSAGNKKKAGKKEDIFAILERTPCFGTCPVYKLIIYPDGHAVYEGFQHVTHTGKYTTTFTKEELKAIADKAESINYFKLKNNYDSPVTDFPTTVTSLTINGKTKTISNRANAPAELREFEIYLEKLFKDKPLKKMAE